LADIYNGIAGRRLLLFVVVEVAQKAAAGDERNRIVNAAVTEAFLLERLAFILYFRILSQGNELYSTCSDIGDILPGTFGPSAQPCMIKEDPITVTVNADRGCCVDLRVCWLLLLLSVFILLVIDI
jgi:hypothetical protein